MKGDSQSPDDVGLLWLFLSFRNLLHVQPPCQQSNQIRPPSGFTLKLESVTQKTVQVSTTVTYSAFSVCQALHSLPSIRADCVYVNVHNSRQFALLIDINHVRGMGNATRTRPGIETGTRLWRSLKAEHYSNHH